MFGVTAAIDNILSLLSTALSRHSSKTAQMLTLLLTLCSNAISAVFQTCYKVQKNTGNRNFQCLFAYKCGGRYKTRTCDLPHVKRMRYQLRQSSIFIGNGYSTRCRWICQYFFSVSHINRAFGGFSVAREDDLHRSCAYARHGAGAVFVGRHGRNVRVGR